MSIQTQRGPGLDSIELAWCWPNLTELTAGIESTQILRSLDTVHNHMVFQIRQQNLAEALGKKSLIKSE